VTVRYPQISHSLPKRPKRFEGARSTGQEPGEEELTGDDITSSARARAKMPR